MQAPHQTSSAIAERRTFALSMVCLTNNVVYRATVTTSPGDARVYIGITEHSFKTRFNNHKVSFKHRKHSHDTVLSKYIWDLKDSDTNFSIKWSIVMHARSYRGNPSRCYLCLMEKLCILSADKSTLLNKRSELITKCSPENKFSAANQKRDRFTHPPWVSLNFIPTVIYGTVWWSLRAWNSSNCVTISLLN